MNTKTESYIKTMANLGNLQDKVYNVILHYPNLSREEISKYSGLRISCVCGRVKELMNYNLIRVSGKVYNKDTNRNVETLAVIEGVN